MFRKTIFHLKILKFKKNLKMINHRRFSRPGVQTLCKIQFLIVIIIIK